MNAKVLSRRLRKLMMISQLRLRCATACSEALEILLAKPLIRGLQHLPAYVFRWARDCFVILSAVGRLYSLDTAEKDKHANPGLRQQAVHFRPALSFDRNK